MTSDERIEELERQVFASVCHDAHCEFDCEGWRAAVESFRESHGTRTAKELIEEFAAAEARVEALRLELERVREFEPCMAEISEGERSPGVFCCVPFGVHDKAPMLHPFVPWNNGEALRLQFAAAQWRVSELEELLADPPNEGDAYYFRERLNSERRRLAGLASALEGTKEK